MSIHYFIGIKIPLPAAGKMTSQRDTWNLESHRRHPLAEDLHITLLFLGGDPHGEIHAVAEALAEISHPPFELEISGVAHFGIPERPRVVYAALEENEQLNGLQGKISETLRAFQLSPDISHLFRISHSRTNGAGRMCGSSFRKSKPIISKLANSPCFELILPVHQDIFQ